MLRNLLVCGCVFVLLYVRTYVRTYVCVMLVDVVLLHCCSYGLETFAQLVQEGCLRFSELHIEDYPSFRHRGMMLDTG